jgi:hypothetical protein
VPVSSVSGNFSGGEIRSISVSGKELWAVLDNITIVQVKQFIKLKTSTHKKMEIKFDIMKLQHRLELKINTFDLHNI